MLYETGLSITERNIRFVSIFRKKDDSASSYCGRLEREEKVCTLVSMYCQSQQLGL